jgi:hypothetical protein
VEECRAIADLPRLTTLELNPASLRGLASNGLQLPHVTFASLDNYWGSDDLRHLAASLPGLLTLTIAQVEGDLAPLSELPVLSSVTIFVSAPLRNAPPHVEVNCPPASRY